jgi:hypothetical protein
MKADHGRIQIALARAMSERFNAPSDRSCPICYRVGALRTEAASSDVLECGGCFARFHFEPATKFQAATLVRIRTRTLKRLTIEELDRVRGGSA